MYPLGMIARLCFGGAIFILIHKGIFGTIVNSNALSDGICQTGKWQFEILMDCDIERITVNIELSNNILLDCRNYSVFSCQSTLETFHNDSSGILKMTIPFDHAKHEGYTLWVNTTCRNNSVVKQNILLKPCPSGLTTAAYHNDTHITISCEHDFFRFYPGNGIRIVDKNDLAHCWWKKENQTNECSGDAVPLTNGAKITTPYTKEMNITCKFDELSVEIIPQQQTTAATITTTITTKSPAASPSNQSGDSGQAKPTCCVSTISILSILSFIHRDIFI